MFKKIPALMLLCAIPWIIGMTKPVRAEYIGINELQTEANIEWKKEYVDRYGRTVSVDVTPIIPQVDKVPIQIMENQILPVENVLNIALSGVEASLDTRQNVLKRVLDDCRKDYSHVLLDCMPSLGVMTINALAAADSVLIPTIPHYLSVDGLGKLMESIVRMRRGLNMGLRVEGILITMASRTTYAREISELLRTQYGTKIKVFDTVIPHSIRAAECSAEGKSIFSYDPKGKVAQAYNALTKEVIQHEKQRQKHRAEIGR